MSHTTASGQHASVYITKLCWAQVVELMGDEKGWWYPKRQRELKRAKAFLSTFTSQPDAPGTKNDSPKEGTHLVSSQEKGGGA